MQVTGLSAPQGVAVSLLTGESWVTSTNSQVIYRFPVYETLQANQAPTAQINSSTPLALALDQFDNLIVAEGLNRLSFYFPQMYYRHAASYAAGINSSAVPTPGMLALLARYGSNFNLTPTTSVQNTPPWQTTAATMVRVIVNSVAAPVYFLESSVIHFQIPMITPDFGTADFVVQSASTGQILAAKGAIFRCNRPRRRYLYKRSGGDAAESQPTTTIRSEATEASTDPALRER